MAEFRDLSAVVAEAIAALEIGGTDEYPLTEGRLVKVLASPRFDSAAYMAMGLAILPANYTTPAHSHEAEEIALVLQGSGVIDVAGVSVPVSEGSVVVAPPNASHTTSAGPDGPLVVYWTYGPAGSEDRWLTSGASR
jgi:quercetin dioxygenase-like cupin family protein